MRTPEELWERYKELTTSPWTYIAEKKAIVALIAECVEEEREDCARLAEAAHGAGAHTKSQQVIAAAIRARRAGGGG